MKETIMGKVLVLLGALWSPRAPGTIKGHIFLQGLSQHLLLKQVGLKPFLRFELPTVLAIELGQALEATEQSLQDKDFHKSRFWEENLCL